MNFEEDPFQLKDRLGLFLESGDGKKYWAYRTNTLYAEVGQNGIGMRIKLRDPIIVLSPDPFREEEKVVSKE